MRTIVKFILAMGMPFLTGSVMADTIVTGSSVSQSSSQAGTSSEASFTGNDGRHAINEDVIEIRQGQLTVNGLPYGTVSPGSSIRFSVQGDRKSLIVDGKVRPLRK